MDILIEVNGSVGVPDGVTRDAVTDAFIDWIEAQGWYFGGSFVGEGPITFGGTVYSLERALTEEEVETALRAWFRARSWAYDGCFRAILDDI